MIAHMIYVISIAKRYNHARTHYKDPRNRGIKGAKPVLGIYYYTEELKFQFRKISLLLVPYYHTKLWKRKRFVCLECGGKFLCLVKKDTDNPPCPNCEGDKNGNFLILS
jgi:hypothetical protein